MTTTSVLCHSGFHDLLELVISTPSRLGLVSSPAPPLINNSSGFRSTEPIGVRMHDDGVAQWTNQETVASPGPKSVGDGDSGGGRGKDKDRKHRDKNGMNVKGRGDLRYRRVDKRTIGPPTNFRHIFHASTYEEATELLLRWSVVGVDDKLGDPSWSEPIKDLVKARAREQQARAVAAVVEASRLSRILTYPGSNLGGPSSHPLGDSNINCRPFPAPGQLHVVNGLPSSIYSTTNTSIVSPMLRTGTPALIAALTPSRLEATLAAETLTTLGDDSSPNLADELPNPFDTDAPLPSGIASSTEAVELDHTVRGLPPTSLPIPPIPKVSLDKSRDELEAIAREIAGLPMYSSTVAVADLAGAGPSHINVNIKKQKQSEVALQQQTVKQTSHVADDHLQLPFRVVKPSLATLEKAMSVALFFEQFYYALLCPSSGVVGCSGVGRGGGVGIGVNNMTLGGRIHPGNYVLSRARRLAELEAYFLLSENRWMTEADKDAARSALNQDETQALRERRKKVDVKGFDIGRVIGHGAFGVVRIAREKDSGRLVAMKQLRKADMLRKAQEGHVRAEKDLLAAAASQFTNSNSTWIVQLFYAFQDADHLYLVLEYMGGGDLLNLLVERDTFPESMTRFYVAEMVLALEQTHALGYIHRDIKPDNFLFTPQGHIRVSDFGLATDLHWAHDTTYYEIQRKELLKRHGIHLEDSNGGGGMRGGGKTRRMKRSEVERIMGKEWVENGGGVLSWRDKNRKRLAYSVCGTNSYMAPEVIRGQGYGFSCDWWSLGIIMYESLYGYPPFSSSSRHITRQKILDWKNTLRFPTKPRLSRECTDLMTRLLCEPEDRLGASPIVEGGSASGFRSDAGNGTGFSHVAGSTRSAILGKDGAENIKAHPWFAGIDWSNLHKMTPPYQPNLRSEDDTRHFDDNIPDEPLAPANGAAPDSTKDPLLNDKVHGAHLLEIRKSLAFKGWTFKALPKTSPASMEKRYGHLARITSRGVDREDEDDNSINLESGMTTPRATGQASGKVHQELVGLGQGHGVEETGDSLDVYHDAVDGEWEKGAASGAGGTMKSVISGAGTVRSRALSL